jgi:ubiquinone/menaquinone biosynthesis C-methylase UbiE
MTHNHKQSFFNELASRWDCLPDQPETATVARFVGRCLGDSARRILDVGCGTGILLPYLGRERAPREIVELDLAECMLLENRKKPEARIAAHVCADARRPPFRKASFDRVICFNTLPHLTPIDETLRELLECLCPGGVLSIGHSMGSEQLNEFHSGLGGPVGHDRLPPARILARMLSGMAVEVLCAEDASGWYCVQVRKR